MTLGLLTVLTVALLAVAVSAIRSMSAQTVAVDQCSVRSIGDE